MKKSFTKEEMKARATRRAAFVLYELWEESLAGAARPHSRLLERLVPDHLANIHVGKSKKLGHDGVPRREHLVPLIFINNWCFDQIFGRKPDAERNQLIDEAAKFIEAHYKIAIITREERDTLDGMPGLKTGMPVNWVPGCYKARLERAQIEIE